MTSIQISRFVLHIAIMSDVPTFALSDNFIIKLMNDYLTPRRRHSSLFQRMEDEIHKISRKLSAAKQHKDAHRTPTPTPLRQQSPGLTVRRHHQNPTPPPPSQELTRKWDTVLADRTNNSTLDPKRAPIRRLRFNHRVE